MSVNISQHVTNNWPSTEALLEADTGIDYAAIKSAEIAAAKRDVYGTATAPAEADIPDIVAEWIGDRATVRLIPVGKEWYAINRYRSKSNRAGDTLSNYDLIAMLDGLRDELQAACAEAWPEVEELVGSSVTPVSVPAVSHEGAMLDPTARALERGLP